MKEILHGGHWSRARLLDAKLSRAPALEREERFGGFVFKIQANMDPMYRDRIAFMRVVSGKYVKRVSVFHPRLGKDV